MHNENQLWSKLQNLAIKHSSHLFGQEKGRKINFERMRTLDGRKSDSYICTNDEHEETTKILGSGDYEQIGARIHWYLVYYPQFFDGSTHAKQII